MVLSKVVAVDTLFR